MDWPELTELSRRAIDVDINFNRVPGRYEGTAIPLPGHITIVGSRNSIGANLVESGDWWQRLTADLPPSPISPGAVFRDVTPGVFTGRAMSGRLVGDVGEWIFAEATYAGESHCATRDGFEATYRFDVDKFVTGEATYDDSVAASRLIFAGGEWASRGVIAGRKFVVAEGTRDEPERSLQTISVTIEGAPEALEVQALQLALGFVTGNTLATLMTERYAEGGARLRVEHERGGGISVGRRAPFFQFEAAITCDGLSRIAEGILQLLRDGFPIDVVLHHLHEASTGAAESDAQRLVLAIHTAFEAWNDKFGREEWIKGKPWKKIARAIRHGIDPAIIDTLPADVREAVVANLMADVNHSNRTSMAWRQEMMFSALKIDVSDAENARALGLRNTLLHNGYFKKRWHQLTNEEVQQRRDDIERLRRLTFMIVFRLTGFRGFYLNPIRFTPEFVETVTVTEDAAFGPSVSRTLDLR